jgi:predicted small lipoprotein YifL
MKILFKYVVLLAFVFTLAACGRMGDLISNEDSQIDSEDTSSSVYLIN